MKKDNYIWIALKSSYLETWINSQKHLSSRTGNTGQHTEAQNMSQDFPNSSPFPCSLHNPAKAG